MLFAGLGGPLGVSAVLSLENKHPHLTVHWADVSTALGLVLFPSLLPHHMENQLTVLKILLDKQGFFSPTSCIYTKSNKQSNPNAEHILLCFWSFLNQTQGFIHIR